MKYLRRKTKKFTTKKSAEDEAVKLGLREKIEKDDDGNDIKVKSLSTDCKYTDINLSENEIMTEKEITTEAEMIEYKDVDSTLIHFCDHDEKKQTGCKLLDIKESKKKFVKIKEVEKVVKVKK